MLWPFGVRAGVHMVAVRIAAIVSHFGKGLLVKELHSFVFIPEMLALDGLNSEAADVHRMDHVASSEHGGVGLGVGLFIGCLRGNRVAHLDSLPIVE